MSVPSISYDWEQSPKLVIIGDGPGVMGLRNNMYLRYAILVSLEGRCTAQHFMHWPIAP